MFCWLQLLPGGTKDYMRESASDTAVEIAALGVSSQEILKIIGRDVQIVIDRAIVERHLKNVPLVVICHVGKRGGLDCYCICQ